MKLMCCARRQMAKVGMRKTERCLPVGSVVTVIGQLDESVLARDPTHAAALGLGGENGAGAPSSSASSGQGTAAEPSAPPLPPGMPFFNPFGSSRAPLPPAVPAAGTSHPPAGSSALTVGAGGAPIPYLLLRKPAGGGPFIITPLTLQQLYESMSRVSRVYQVWEGWRGSQQQQCVRAGPQGPQGGMLPSSSSHPKWVGTRRRLAMHGVCTDSHIRCSASASAGSCNRDCSFRNLAGGSQALWVRGPILAGSSGQAAPRPHSGAAQARDGSEGGSSPCSRWRGGGGGGGLGFRSGDANSS